MRKTVLAAAAAGLLLASTGCVFTTVREYDSVPEKPAQADPNGWHCEELFHTKNQEPYRIPQEQEESDRAELGVYADKGLVLTNDWTITGWFDQDVSIAIDKAAECSESAKGKTSYADAEYGDTWYFDIVDPAGYVHGLPERLMPDYIRISYMPKGSIIVNERECILINFSYVNEAHDAVSDSMAFTYFNGPDTTNGWNWNTPQN